MGALTKLLTEMTTSFVFMEGQSYLRSQLQNIFLITTSKIFSTKIVSYCISGSFFFFIKFSFSVQVLHLEILTNDPAPIQTSTVMNSSHSLLIRSFLSSQAKNKKQVV